MSNYACKNCEGKYNWHWQEAFLRIDCWANEFNTCCVEGVLARNGYQVEATGGRTHNIICSIKKDGVDQIPLSAKVGYDNPQEYLPKEIVAILDKTFLTEWPYVFEEPQN